MERKLEPITSLLIYVYIRIEMKKLLERRLEAKGQHSCPKVAFLDQNCVVITNHGALWKVQLQCTCETSQLVDVGPLDNKQYSLFAAFSRLKKNRLSSEL